MSKTNKLALLPVMLCFFAMGFVDLVGIASNYVKNDLQLSDSTANVFPSLVFFWFLIFSVPTGMLMNKIGRKKTVLLSLIVTLFSLLLPHLLASHTAHARVILTPWNRQCTDANLVESACFYRYEGWEPRFNPHFRTVCKGYRLLHGTLSRHVGSASQHPSLWSGWRVLFPIYLVIGVLTTLLLFSTPIKEEPIEGKASSFIQCLSLLGKPIVLLSFLGIMCHVGIDVGTNTTAPKILMERFNMTLNDAAFATSLYFIFRTLGCLTGSFFLRVMNNKLFFAISVLMMAAAMVWLGVGTRVGAVYVAIALVGYGNSNIFSMVFARALQSVPDKQNEVSGLMIMGLFGGTIFPLFMGFASDAMAQQLGAVIVMAVAYSTSLLIYQE